MWPIIDFEFTDQGQTADLWRDVVRSIFLDPCTGKFLSFIQWMQVGCSGHMVKGQGQTVGLVRSNYWIKCDISKMYCLFCQWTKQTRFSLASYLLTTNLKLHCIYATLLNFAPGEHLCFSNIPCFVIKR